MAKINPDWLAPAFPRPASKTPTTPLDSPQNGVTKLELFVACALMSVVRKRGLSLNPNTKEYDKIASSAVGLAISSLEAVDACKV